MPVPLSLASKLPSAGVSIFAIMTRLAELWRVRFGLPGDQYRFDVIAIEEGTSSTSPQLTHIEDAWRGVGK